ncbi:MAG: hypothetical protein Q8R47_03415 [Nanoarchaeota archaeon]|nr:hypothetical protein [Nanoarchaeota archaeon]
MSFLEKLMNWDRSLQDGKEIVRLPRTWRNNLPWNAQPFCYKTHQTQAGLYAVLPYKEDGSLFLKYPPSKIERIQTWPAYDHHVGNSFYLQETQVKTKGEYFYLGSKVSRSSFHNETKIKSTISVAYSIRGDGALDSLRIYYDLLLHKKHFKKVWFEVYRNHAINILDAKGPMIKTNLNASSAKIGVNYDATLENVVNLLLPEELGPEQFRPLFTLDYLELHTLH